MQHTAETPHARLLPALHLSPRQWRMAGAGALALLVLGISAAYIGSMLFYTRGHLSTPLDDTIIYFQYARQAAHGQIMRYQDGAPRSTGATGFAYPLVLAAGYLAGFRESRIMAFALGFNIAMLLATVAMTFVLARRMMDERAAWLAAVFVALNAWLGWTFLSMMETGIHTVFVLALLYCYARARDSRSNLPAFAALLALAPFVRPEQGALALIAGLAFAIDAAFLPGARDWKRIVAAPAAAIIGICAFFAVVYLTTGTVRTNTFVVQSVIGIPNTPYPVVTDVSARNFLDFFQTAFTFFGPLYIATAAFLLFAYGAASAIAEDWERRAVSFRSLMPVLALAGFASTSILGDVGGQNHRWAAPYEPLIIIVSAYGAWRACAALPALQRLAPPLIGIGLIMSAAMTVSMINVYGQNNADIYYQHIVAAEWVRDNAPPDAIVGMNDAGALAYFSRRRVFDLLGLTGPINNADTAWQGSASVLEAIERMPESDRPTMYVIYPDWWSFSGSNVRFLSRQTGFLLSRRTVAGGQDEVVYNADNSLLNSGEQAGTLPPDAAGWQIVDSIDVADERSERDHAYTYRQREVGAGPKEIIALRNGPGIAAGVLDGARSISGYERFRFRPDPAKPYAIVARIDEEGPGVFETATVKVNGAESQLTLPLAGTIQFQNALIVKGGPGADTLNVSITARPGSAGYHAYHYWLLQP